MPDRLRDVFLVFIGGFFGSLTRYLVGLASPSIGDFPAAVFTVNILGSLIIGLVAGRLLTATGETAKTLRLTIMTGFLGGFTTYSAFALETFLLVSFQNLLPALIYALSTVVFGVLAAALGLRITRGKQ